MRCIQKSQQAGIRFGCLPFFCLNRGFHGERGRDGKGYPVRIYTQKAIKAEFLLKTSAENF